MQRVKIDIFRNKKSAGVSSRALALLRFLYITPIHGEVQKLADQLVAAVAGPDGQIVDPLHQFVRYPDGEHLMPVLPFRPFWR